MKRKAPIVLSVLAAVVALAALNVLSISVASIVGVSILLATGCIKPSEAYKSVEWNILILIYGMLALGETMKVTGVSGEIASLVGRVGMGLADPAWSAFAVLIVLYLITAFLTEVLSNNATIVIMAPIALELAPLIDAYRGLAEFHKGPICQALVRFLCCGFRQLHNPDRLSDEYIRLHGGRLSV